MRPWQVRLQSGLRPDCRHSRGALCEFQRSFSLSLQQRPRSSASAQRLPRTCPLTRRRRSWRRYPSTIGPASMSAVTLDTAGTIRRPPSAATHSLQFSSRPTYSRRRSVSTRTVCSRAASSVTTGRSARCGWSVSRPTCSGKYQGDCQRRADRNRWRRSVHDLRLQAGGLVRHGSRQGRIPARSECARLRHGRSRLWREEVEIQYHRHQLTVFVRNPLCLRRRHQHQCRVDGWRRR